MKWMWCAAVVVATAVSASAQGTPGGAGTQQKPAAQARESGSVTLTGCLQADKSKMTFWLSDAATAGGQKTPSSTATGTETSPGKVEQMKKSAAAETYRLNPSGSVTLDPHVGHKVQITGTMDPAGKRAEARGTTGTTGAETKHLENARQVNVTAVKHISEVCEPGKQ